ncbi:MAG: DUF805 domain-containing protein [Rhodospirillaceae bacterium]|nr:DUF805 domain-containing protein [Rhodospirillaceae bacterium]MDE0619965.1 DUF805 domain-containing protein [Rhodospirillaceae bacterium]
MKPSQRGAIPCLVTSVHRGIIRWRLGIESGFVGIGLVSTAIVIVSIIPSIAVTVRRLHDIGRNGWWYLIAFIPLVGPLVLLVICATVSQEKDNAYGPFQKSIT